MKTSFSLHFVFLFFAILFNKNIAAQPMKLVSAEIQQFQIPVLKGNETNPVLQIRIETSGSEKPLNLSELEVEIEGTDINKDIEKVEIYYTEDNPVLREGYLFGIPKKPASKIIFSGHQKLNEGTNIFWVSFKLTANANILNVVNSKCVLIKINNKKITPKIVSEVNALQMGIALRKHNDEGVHTFRIPGLVTTNNGTLIAVYDIRRNNSADLQGDIDVGMNRSTDGGLTWEPMKIIMDMGEWGGLSNTENGIGDPSVLVDRQTNTIWVAALWAYGKSEQRFWTASGPGISPQETGQIMLVKSTNNGKTWSNPQNITSQTKNKDWYLFLQGPGKGISLKDGTLVFPAQFKDENEVPHATIIFSKDQGKTWNSGTGAKPNTTEAQLIELNDSSLMLNMRDDRNRSNKSETNGRTIMISNDLGETWKEHPSSNNALIEPNCMASLIKEEFLVDGKLQSIVLFSNPNSKYRREKMTLKISFDDAKTWPNEYYFLVDELMGNGYSCLTKIDENNVGILYEGSQADLVFQIIPIEKIIQQHQLNYIFKSGTEGYKTFRIPAIVTTNSGNILAFAEGRVNGSSDTGNIDLVMKSSSDGGKTWGPLQIIWNDGENVCGNPAPVVDRETGEIHLLMTWNLGSDHESQIISGESKDTRRVFVSSSKNDGELWSVPKEITKTTKSENWTWYATGPCHGIQLQNKINKGRLIIPCDHIEAGTRKYFSHIIYSDDHGKTWQLGGSTLQDQVNECTVAELQNGNILLNMRNYDRTQKTRKTSQSADGGLTWSAIQPDTFLTEPICQASLISSEDKELLYFLNPASSESRTNMTLKSSDNFGETWKTLKVLNSGASAYSDLTWISKNKLGCFYEAGTFSPYEGIVFTTFEFK